MLEPALANGAVIASTSTRKHIRHGPRSHQRRHATWHLRRLDVPTGSRSSTVTQARSQLLSVLLQLRINHRQCSRRWGCYNVLVADGRIDRAETPIVGYTPLPQTPITIPDTTPQRSLGVMAQVAADAKRKFDAQFSREPVPNVFPGSIEPRTLFANEALEQAFDAGHIVSRRGR